jgi:hypothetical protein
LLECVCKKKIGDSKSRYRISVLYYLQLLTCADWERGQKYRLHQYLGAHAAELRKEWDTLPIDEIRALESELRQACEAKDQRAVTRAEPKAIQNNVNATFKSMDHEVRDLIYWRHTEYLQSCFSGDESLLRPALRASTLRSAKT